jgi:hypothetical protein
VARTEREIAAQMGCAVSTVHRILMRTGFNYRARRRIMRAEVVKIYEDNPCSDVRTLATMYQLPERTVRNWLREAGILRAIHCRPTYPERMGPNAKRAQPKTAAPAQDPPKDGGFKCEDF